MKKIIAQTLLVLASICSIFFSVAPLAKALNCSDPTVLTAKQQVQCGACGAAGSISCTPGDAPSDLSNTIHSVIKILSLLGGAAAVVMVIVGGFRYITSAGNPEQAKAARSTITYAIIGIIIIAFAQIIVHFTIDAASK
jgi:hypothetical protein